MSKTNRRGQHWLLSGDPSSWDGDVNHMHAVGLGEKEKKTSVPLLQLLWPQIPSHLLGRGIYHVRGQEKPSNLFSGPSMPGKRELSSSSL